MPNSNFNDVVASELRGEIARQALSPAKVAEAVGMSKRTFYRVLSGRRPMTITELDAVTSALGLPVTALFKQRTESIREHGLDKQAATFDGTTTDTERQAS